jgi:hypothetical protein
LEFVIVNGVSIVLTTGDFVFDHHIYEGCRHHFSDGVSNGVHVEPQLGGAALVHQLLDCLFVPTKGAYVAQLAVKEPEDEKEVDDSQRAYAFWRPFPRNESRDKQFWRVSEAMEQIILRPRTSSCFQKAVWASGMRNPAGADCRSMRLGGLS